MREMDEELVSSGGGEEAPQGTLGNLEMDLVYGYQPVDQNTNDEVDWVV